MDAFTWGQVVVGPPGSGKSTYCTGMQQFLSLAGRKVAVVNLDPGAAPLCSLCNLHACATRRHLPVPSATEWLLPGPAVTHACPLPAPCLPLARPAANDATAYTPAVDIGDLVSLEAVQVRIEPRFSHPNRRPWVVADALGPHHAAVAGVPLFNELLPSSSADHPTSRHPTQPSTPLSRPPHLQTPQAELGLGPNGGLVYCLDYLEQNMDWLRQQLEPLEQGAARAQPGMPPATWCCPDATRPTWFCPV